MIVKENILNIPIKFASNNSKTLDFIIDTGKAEHKFTGKGTQISVYGYIGKKDNGKKYYATLQVKSSIETALLGGDRKIAQRIKSDVWTDYLVRLESNNTGLYVLIISGSTFADGETLEFRNIKVFEGEEVPDMIINNQVNIENKRFSIGGGYYRSIKSI